MSTTSPLSTLCDKCKAIPFDNSQKGGHAVQGDDGHEYLGLADGGEMQCFESDYTTQDLYPSFPSLSRSALAGCKFCEFLKRIASIDIEAYLRNESLDVSKGFKVNIHMMYLWLGKGSSPEDPTGGLRTLFITFFFRSNDNNGL
ncbi:hypothetical protein F4820DRAFT_72365 [Hypoxylon rubiginosum]|uniref:Uncharacterized protein n=1 Tax=Hypoxylon rubiginosum TaxID=110542 RepID=A0ACB9YPQ7_9PEZI|nr:hypothetical protein F4820DRAFT_72365 [Hypoxylon rubiginosum]